MAKSCVICDKTQGPGIKYKRRGARKLGGGAGAKIVGKTLRRMLPNLQRIKILLNKSVQRAWVCTGCIKAGKISKA